MIQRSSWPASVAVESGAGLFGLSDSKMCCKNNTFLFFPTFSQVLLISFRNYCYTATAHEKMRDFKRKVKIIEDICRSSCRSSPVAVRSSRVAVETGQNWTATGNYYLKSIGCEFSSRVAVIFIRAYKSRFSVFFGLLGGLFSSRNHVSSSWF